jgi:hypothetical protein
MRHGTEGEQPFPDSWISTTAPVALGCLTDIISEVILAHGAEGAIFLWPCIGNLIQRWCNGEVKMVGETNVSSGWAPSEALVRISCREIIRFATRLTDRLPNLERDDAEVWANAFITFYTDTLTQTLDIQHAVRKKLLNQKLKSYRRSKAAKGLSDTNGFSNEHLIDEDEKIDLATPYGNGLLVDRRVNYYDAGDVKIDVVNLSFGILYRQSAETPKKHEKDAVEETDDEEGKCPQIVYP